MILTIDMPLSAANALQTAPPPQGVTISSVEQQMTNIDPGGDITVSVTLSIKGAMFVVGIAGYIVVWLRNSFGNKPTKRIYTYGKTVVLDSSPDRKWLEEQISSGIHSDSANNNDH